MISKIKEIIKAADNQTIAIMGNDIYYEIGGEGKVNKEYPCLELLDELTKQNDLDCQFDNMQVFIKYKN